MLQKKKGNNSLVTVVLVILLIISFFYRLYGLNANYSFWTDENHVAIFARAILAQGKPILLNGYSTGTYQRLQYWLSAISAKVFGLNELSIRLPSVIFGVLTVWAVYLLGNELFNRKVGFVAALFITFLKIEILWSRQARPYQGLQFFYLLAAWFVYKLANKEMFDWRLFFGFLICGTLSSLMHRLGLIVIFFGSVYLLLFPLSRVNKKLMVLEILPLAVFGFIFRVQIFSFSPQLGRINNLFYYRVFLWHNYSLLVFLALIGFLSLILKKKKSWWIPVLFLIVQGAIVSFFPGRFIRYFYIVFPFLVILSAVGIDEIRKIFPEKWRLLLLTILIFFIVAMGHKFTLFPKKIYSLNEDMQEIPEIDWKKVYGFVKDKTEQNPNSVLAVNWNDLPIWFLGEGKLNYLIRKRGITQKTKIDPFSSAFIVETLEEFENVIRMNKMGVLVIDSWDNRVPEGVREYCRQNLKKELEVDRLYPVQPRYWPVTVFSWGI